MRKYIIISLLALLVSSCCAEKSGKDCVRPVKNVILMVPDGTSTSVLPLAKWYKWYIGERGFELNLNDYICGLMSTTSSDGIIPGSAAAMSAIVTGVPHRARNLSIYPTANPGQDIVDVNPAMSFQPLATVMEAARLENDSSIGIVATSYFHHATPAACLSHTTNRHDTLKIARQMASNGIDVLFAGGTDAINSTVRRLLDENGVSLIENDIVAFRNYDLDRPIWSVFGKKEMGFEIDRDTSRVPSLSEMTSKAIELLSKDKNGFFLMVEGSMVDYAAHAKEPNTVITEFLAFDSAVGVALDFAKKDGNTAVIVVSDHGTSGMTAMKQGVTKYVTKGIDSIFVNMKEYKASYKKLGEILSVCRKDEIRSLFKEWTNIELTDSELANLIETSDIKENDYMQVADSQNFEYAISSILASRTNITFANSYHTPEHVFLAVYHPDGDIPHGILTNRELNEYLCRVSGLKKPLSEVTKSYFVRHDELLEGYKFELNIYEGIPHLTIFGKDGNVVVKAWENVVSTSKGKHYLPVAPVYIEENGLFYLPQQILKVL